jgi:Undecaprenyl-phosphate glucose phosphotransferase
MIRNGQVDQVLVALPWSAWERVRNLVDAMSVAPVRVLLAPALPDDFVAPSFATIGNVPMLNLAERPLAFWDLVIKQIEDRVLSVALMIPLAPVFLVIAAAIKLDSPGPVFFRQRRFGYNNEEIMVWKFRTMRTDMCDPTGAVQATKSDPRVTRVGAFLRRTSLDELPQILNVLQGNMSIVGPRPHAVSTRIGDKLMHHCVERYDARHNVKPGITGWAQIHGLRGEASSVELIEQRVAHDLYYIRNWSLALDLYIILRTALLVFRDDRAY